MYRFHSMLPAVRCYSYLAATTLSLAYAASRLSVGIGILPFFAVELVMLTGQYYLSPYIIGQEYHSLYGAKEVHDGPIYEAAQAVKGQLQDTWRDVKVYSYESSELNAFAVGLTSGTAAVYVSTGLVENLKQYAKQNNITPQSIGVDQQDGKEDADVVSERMLQAVLAHEFGHITGRHAVIGCISRSLVIIIDGAIEYLKHRAEKVKNEKPKKDEDKAAKKRNEASLYVAQAVAGLFKVFGVSAVSRSNEYMADNMAVELGYAMALQHALASIHGSTIAKVGVKRESGFWSSMNSYFSWFEEFFASHPSLNNRVMAAARAERDYKDAQENPNKSMYCAESVSKLFAFIMDENRSHFAGVNPESGALVR